MVGFCDGAGDESIVIEVEGAHRRKGAPTGERAHAMRPNKQRRPFVAGGAAYH